MHRNIASADIPMQLPTHSPIDTSTAKGLGLTIPPSILSHADEVIE